LAWRDLLKELDDEDDFSNLPLTIVSLAQALGAQYKGRPVVIILDELQEDYAPKTDSPKHYDFSSLTNALLPDNIRLLCCINPATDLPLLLTPCQPSFVTVRSEKQYRNTQILIKLGQFLMAETHYGVARNDKAATDVPGSPARLTDLGKLEEVEKLRQVLRTEMAVMKEEGRKPGVILYESIDNSPEVTAMMEQEGAAAGWQVTDVREFAGCEEDNIIFLGPGHMEAVTRAKLHLSVVLYWDPQSEWSDKRKSVYDEFSVPMHRAANMGLMEDVTARM
jgi:hypothetical protein